MRSLRRYAGILSAASAPPIIEFSSRFARTVILSRLLTPIDLGAAIALVTIYGTCEVLADVGLNQFVMVSADANRAQAVAAARQIGIIRGVVLSLLIAASAPALADLFGAKGHVDSIRWLSIVPLLWSFRNWRTVQIQREYDYRPEAISVSVASVSGMIAVFPAIAWFHDERAMLASLIVEAGLYVIVSHVVLPRERVVAVDPLVRQAALTFGLPLMANGIGLVILSQADRIMISNLFGLVVLAHYSLVVGLAVVPISVISMVLGKILMAFIVRSRSEPAEAREASFIATWVPFIAAAVYALAIGTLLDIAVPLFYGRQYQVAVGLHALVTLMVFSRICRVGPTAILLAYGQTRRVTAANLTAGAGLAIGFVLGISFRRVEAVMFGVLLGDVLSLLSMFYFARSHLPMPTVLGHLALLLVPAVLSAAGTVPRSGFELEIRALIVAAGVLVVSLDVIAAYSRTLGRFMANSS